MINYAIQTFEEFNQTGIDNLLVYINQTNSNFILMFLISLMIIITLSVYYGGRKYSGQGDIFAAFATSSLITFTFALLMTLKSGLINIKTLTIMIVITLISILLLFSKPKGQ